MQRSDGVDARKQHHENESCQLEIRIHTRQSLNFFLLPLSVLEGAYSRRRRTIGPTQARVPRDPALIVAKFVSVAPRFSGCCSAVTTKRNRSKNGLAVMLTSAVSACAPDSRAMASACSRSRRATPRRRKCGATNIMSMYPLALASENPAICSLAGGRNCSVLPSRGPTTAGCGRRCLPKPASARWRGKRMPVRYRCPE